jgi:hypothetical protein
MKPTFISEREINELATNSKNNNIKTFIEE